MSRLDPDKPEGPLVVCVHSQLEVIQVGTTTATDQDEKIELVVKCTDCCATFSGEVYRENV